MGFSFEEIESMEKFDPKALRQRAATYRTRAESEPQNARMLLQLAGDMEAHAVRIEGQRNVSFGGEDASHKS